MMGLPVRKLALSILSGKSSYRFLIGVLLSFSFSISVILGTIGIMDGFDYSLKNSLRSSTEDIAIYHREGFFHFPDSLKKVLTDKRIKGYSSYIQTEAFVVTESISKGVVLKGVETKGFNQLVDLDLELGENEVIVGAELFSQLGLKEGDSIVIAFGNGNKNFSTLPLLKRFHLKKSVRHGIFEKDERFVYMRKNDISQILGVGDKVNMIGVDIHSFSSGDPNENIQRIQEVVNYLMTELEAIYRIRPFWREYSGLMEAVKVEKFSISLILQVVVVISIFNILAFLIFLNEKRSQEIFLLQALGLSKKSVFKIWGTIVTFIWVVSCLLSLVLVQIFDYALRHLALFQLPGDVYVLGQLGLRLELSHYILVFLIAGVWVGILLLIGHWRLTKRPLLEGLRKEFA